MTTETKKEVDIAELQSLVESNHTILGLDIGSKRVGVAISTSDMTGALPLRTMKYSNNEDLLKLSLLHDIGKSISEYNWLFRIMAELKLVTNRKAFDYLNHEDIGYDLLKENIDDPDISKYYFDNLLTEKK